MAKANPSPSLVETTSLLSMRSKEISKVIRP